jgi:hypothetical protein
MIHNKPTRHMRKPRLRRWLGWPAGMLALLLLAVYVLGPRAITPIIRGKLDKMVRSQLNARLEMGSVSYDFPYGVRVRDAVLVADDPDGGVVKLLDIPRLDISLAKLPFGDGPLVVERLILEDPAIHLVKVASGLVGGKLVRIEKQDRQVRLSEMFQLRLVSIDEGRIIYEDRTRPDSVPVVWRNIDVTVTTSPVASPVYTFDFTAISRAVARMTAAGTFDIDELHLNVEKLATEFIASADRAETAAPAELQRLLDEHGVAGRVSLQATAQVPLRNLRAATFDARLTLRDATAGRSQPGRVDELRADIHISTSPLTAVQELKSTAILLRQGIDLPAARPATEPGTGAPAAIDQLRATAARLGEDPDGPAPGPGVADGPGDVVAQLRQTATVLRQQEQAEKADEPGPVAGVADGPDDAVAQLRRTAMLLRQQEQAEQPAAPPASAPAASEPALYVLIEDAVVNIGDNRLEVYKAGLTLDWDEMSWRLAPAHGLITLGDEQQALPRAVRQINQDLLLMGTADLNMTGHGRLLPRPDGKLDYTFNVRAHAPRVRATDRRLEFTSARADIAITPGGVSFPDNGATTHGLYGEFYGGAVRAMGQVRPHKPLEYAFIVRAAGVDMEQFGQAWPREEEQPLRMNGTGSGKMHLYGTGRIGEKSAISNLRGQGDFEIRDGDFYDVPVLAQILNSMKGRSAPGTMGYAAGVFNVREKTVGLHRIAISAPVLGVQGSGKVNFDAEMDLKVVAAPLADWKQNLRRSKVPIVGDVAAELAGGIQKLLNTATGKLLYQFRVTGTVGEPRLMPQPVPVLTDDMLQVFAHMLRGGDRLPDEMRR